MNKKNFIAIAMTMIGGLLLSMAGPPANAATNGEIDDAIQDGLAWLASQPLTVLSDRRGGTIIWQTLPRQCLRLKTKDIFLAAGQLTLP
ncbi:MAG: hypothetical protein D3906_03535 [Candidatus Electrothrix sp. AUS1_2]|nr:hypothetical protein [Candidatus Electrothrix sp. AUS1_2]